MPTPEKHALLSASGSERWMHCTRAPRLEETLPEKTSEYAEAGRLAHSIAELKIKKAFIEPMGPKKYVNALKKLQADPNYSRDMDHNTNAYLDYIQGIMHSFVSKPYIATEVRLDYSNYAPEGFGTTDCIIIGGSDLHVIDYKNGAGVPVNAEMNSQLLIYALGAFDAYSIFYDIQTVHLTVFQPALSSISEFTISRNDLLDWGVFTVRPVAQTAFNGEGEFCAGEWCRFCRAKAVCRARSNTMTALEAFGGALPPSLSDNEVGDILNRSRTLKAWVSDLEEYALSALLSGKTIDGWKAVEGRSNRQFTDTDTAFDTVTAAGIDESLLYERKPITLTAVEKLLGKKQFDELLADYIIKPPGSPTLAPVSDKREAITNQTTAAEAFGSKNELTADKDKAEDLKKFLGAPPYDGPENIVRGDPYFAKTHNLN